MKLLDAYEVHDVMGEDAVKQKDFKGHVDGVITLHPGNWFLPKSYARFADKFFNFQFKKDDVVIVTYPKNGTTWTQEIVWTIMNNPNLDNPEANESIDDRSPFLDMDFLMANSYAMKMIGECESLSIMEKFQKLCPGKSSKDGISIQIAEAMEGPRIIKTHLPLSLINPSILETCKVIYVARDPKAVCVSYLHHSRLIKVHDYVGTTENFVDLFINDQLQFSPFWDHVKVAWDQRFSSNCHFVIYEELKANPKREITDISKFLGKDLTNEQIMNIVDYTSFSSMKSRSEMLNLLPEGTFNHEIANAGGGFFRKGESKDYENHLTPEMEKRIDDWTKENTKRLGIKIPK